MPGGLVLLIDDDEDLREAVADILDEHGYEVVHVGNGAKALELLRGGLRPGLILLDLMMPVMDGRQFRTLQRAEAAIAGIPVVVLSAAGNLARYAESLDVAQIVPKPVTPQSLLQVVAQFLP
jgi:CheY-like chemotaxis protein